MPTKQKFTSKRNTVRSILIATAESEIDRVKYYELPGPQKMLQQSKELLILEEKEFSPEKVQAELAASRLTLKTLYFKILEHLPDESRQLTYDKGEQGFTMLSGAFLNPSKDCRLGDSGEFPAPRIIPDSSYWTCIIFGASQTAYSASELTHEKANQVAENKCAEAKDKPCLWHGCKPGYGVEF